jgi:signal peptidase I
MTAKLSTTSKIYYFFVISYLFFTIIVAVIGYGKLPGGGRIFTNKKTSMQPLISENSLTITKPSDYYNVGDIISYYQQVDKKEVIVTHRIAQIAGNVYLTKGDYNEYIDNQVVKPRLVIGKVVLIIPWLGLLFSLIKHPLGNLFFIILPATAIIIREIYRIKKLFKKK